MRAQASAERWGPGRITAAALGGGLITTLLVVVSAPLMDPEPAQRLLLGSWFGLLPARVVPVGQRLPWVLTVLAAVAALVVLWAAVVRAAARRRFGLRAAGALAAAWGTPFMVGPPLFSRDVYSYLAQGTLAGDHLDVYRLGPAALGPNALVAAVGPQWRFSLDPYGPLALRVEQFAVHAGSPLVAVLVLRAVAVLSVIAAVYFGIRLAAPRPAAAVVALYALNPIVLFHLVSGVHLEALLVAVALGGVLLHRRGYRALGIVVLTAAAAVKAPALLAVGVLGLLDTVHAAQARGRRHGALILARDIGLCLLTWALCYLVVPDSLGWLRALSNASSARTLATPAVAAGHLVHRLLHAGPIVLPLGIALTVTTALFALLALLVLLRLLLTLTRRDPLRTAGFALVAICLLGPVVHPWYLMWGFAYLVPAAAGGAVRTRRLLLVISGLLSMLELPGLQGVAPQVVVWSAGALVALIVVAATARSEARPAGPRLGGLARHWLDQLRRVPDIVAGA